MLVHILACLLESGAARADLICVDAFPGIDPFVGLGQLQPFQFDSLHAQRRPVSGSQFRFAKLVDTAFACQDSDRFAAIASMVDAPLPWVPRAVKRWIQEQPDPATGLGRLESLALDAIRSGCREPSQVFAAVAAADETPRFWGDTTLWAKINALADREPPLVRIEGPTARLPQWSSQFELKQFRIRPESSPP